MANDVSSWIVLASVLILIFVGCGIVVKRFFIDKKYFGGAQFVGRQIYEEFQNADGKNSIEYVIRMEQEDHQDDFIDGSDNEPAKENEVKGRG